MKLLGVGSIPTVAMVLFGEKGGFLGWARGESAAVPKVIV